MAAILDVQNGLDFIEVGIVYFWAIPLLVDGLLFYGLARWRRFRWLGWNPPVTRLMVAKAIVCALAFGAAWALAYFCRDIPLLAELF